MSRKNLRRLSALVTAQTLYNLAKLAAMEGRTIGQAIDKLVRDRMMLLRDAQKLGSCHE